MGKIPGYILKKDLPCLKYVKGISGAFGVASFLKNYVATYKSLGWNDDVSLYVRCVELCRTLYSSRRFCENPRDYLLDLSGLNKEEATAVRSFFTVNKVSRDNPPTSEEASAWVSEVLSEKVSFASCQDYYKSFNPDLDCCKLCPFSHKNLNRGVLRERAVLREVVGFTDSLSLFLSAGVKEEMFRSVCDLAGNADPSRDKPVFHAIYGELWKCFVNDAAFFGQLSKLSSFEQKIELISELCAEEAPRWLEPTCGTNLPNALDKTIRAIAYDVFGKGTESHPDPEGLAKDFISGHEEDLRVIEALRAEGVAYPDDAEKRPREDFSETDRGERSRPRTCWRVDVPSEASELVMEVKPSDPVTDAVGGELMTSGADQEGLGKMWDAPSGRASGGGEEVTGENAAPAVLERSSENDNVGNANIPDSSPDGYLGNVNIPKKDGSLENLGNDNILFGDVKPESEDFVSDGAEDADAADVFSRDATSAENSETGACAKEDAALMPVIVKMMALSGGSREGILAPLDHERRPFARSMVSVPFVPIEELEKGCVNLDSAEPRVLTTLLSALAGGIRPCRAKTPSVMSVELVCVGGDSYLYVLYVPSLGTYFFTGLKNGNVRHVLEQAFRYEPLAKYCYMPFMLVSHLRENGITTIKNVRSLYTLSSVAYRGHDLTMEECLALLGCVPYSASDGSRPFTSAALRYMHCYHRAYKAAFGELKVRGLGGVLDRAARFDEALSYTFLHKTKSAYGCLFSMKKAGDYLFPAFTDADLEGKSAWRYSVNPSSCDAPFIIRELLFSLHGERVLRKTDARILSMGGSFIVLSVPKEKEPVLRDRINLMLEGLAHRQGWRYFDYERTRLLPGNSLLPVNPDR